MKSSSLCSTLALTVATLAGSASAPAQPPDSSCVLLCQPKLSLIVAANRSHVMASPRVRLLSTGAVQRLPSRTNLELILFLAVPTTIPRTTLFASTQWLPNAQAKANPFTEYTASEVGEPIRSNAPTVSLGAHLALVSKQSLGGWADLTAQVADLFSQSARPDDKSSYTHKLDLAALADVYPFAHVAKHSYVHGISGFLMLDGIVTGLPRAGDEVPKGTRVFLDDARAVTFLGGLAFPIAPLGQ